MGFKDALLKYELTQVRVEYILQCSFHGLWYDSDTKSCSIVVGAGHCTDFSGSIKLCTTLHPEVEKIFIVEDEGWVVNIHELVKPKMDHRDPDAWKCIYDGDAYRYGKRK